MPLGCVRFFSIVVIIPAVANRASMSLAPRERAQETLERIAYIRKPHGIVARGAAFQPYWVGMSNWAPDVYSLFNA